ncbi:hypothetical protein ACGTN6_02665 [Halomonas sp. THAF12]|uniref:hypothetical protein n=1 Tax=Halomonas sp. B23F22_10 TaxID=3459515 RepID=UPI00373E8176
MYENSQHVYFLRAEDFYRIPSSARGVYAWYIAPPSDLSDNYLEEVNNYYSSIHAAAMGEKISGSRYSVEIKRQPIGITEAVFNNSVRKKHVETALKYLCEFTAPLYVGMAVGQDGIRDRIKNEFLSVEFKRRFVSLAEKAGVSLDFNFEDSLIKYLDVDEMLGGDAGEEEVKNISGFLEVVSFWAEFPALNAKKGN